MQSPESLIKVIKAHIAKGDKAADKAEQHYIAAGQHIKTLKEQHKGTWAEWEALLKERVGIGKSRASELMQIADGTKTLAQVRERTAESVRQARAHSPLRSGEAEMPRISISEEDSSGAVEVTVRTDTAPCGCSPTCEHCGGKMEARQTYKCATAEAALTLIRAYTDPETHEALQAVKRLYRQEQDAWRELAQFLLDHPQFPASVVAGWLKWDDEAGINELRRWAKNGFEGPFPPD